ncbi:MAG TPA: hypothetical protein VFF16_17555 [Telluria sp.]|nr:hypothetical protein [Telluria sp.]
MHDDAFLAGVEAGTLDPARFDHGAHVRLACLYLERWPPAEAAARCCATIARFAAGAGAPAKFHWTVTEALVHLLAAGRRAAVLADARACLARHYSAAVLASPAARAGFVAPDLAPLPPPGAGAAGPSP